jgi:tetratricopeptide (TPR) repeat protein
MAENPNDTSFVDGLNFGEMTDEEYTSFLESNPDLRVLLEEEQKGLLEGTVSLAQIMGVSDTDLLGAATAAADLISEERWEEARDIFGGLTALEPQAPIFHVGLAQALDGLEDTAGAIDAYTQAIDLADAGDGEEVDRRQLPVLGDALYGRGCLHVVADKPDEALADLRRLCDVVDDPCDPRVESALSLIGGLLAGEEGEEIILEADLDDEDPDTSVLDEHPEVGDSLVDDLADVANGTLQAAAMAGMDDADLAHAAETGHTLMENGRYRDAESIFEGLVSLDPTIAIFQLGVGEARENLEDDVGAIESYDAAVEIVDAFDGDGPHEHAFDAYYRRGRYHLRTGNGEQALADLTRAIEIEPDAEAPLTRHAAVLVSAMLSAAEESAQN